MSVGRNDLCFCGSGKKYKKCCLDKDRFLQAPFTFESVFKRMHERGSAVILTGQEHSNFLKQILFDVDQRIFRTPCVSPIDAPCTGEIIASHTVSKENGLRHICDDENHVMMFERKLNLRQELTANVVSVGINKAILFHGFCSQHDASLFEDIDRVVLTPTPKQVFLLSYRSLACEYHARIMLLKKLDAIHQAVADNKAEKNARLQCEVTRPGYVRCLEEVEDLKKLYDEDYVNEEYEKNYRVISRRLPKLPFAISSSFMPKYDLMGKQIPRQISMPWPSLTLNVVPESNSTLVTFMAHRSFEEELGPFLAAIEHLKMDKDFSRAVWEIVLRNIENVALQPVFWNSLSSRQQDRIESFFNATMTHTLAIWIPLPSDIDLARCGVF